MNVTHYRVLCDICERTLHDYVDDGHGERLESVPTQTSNILKHAHVCVDCEGEVAAAIDTLKTVMRVKRMGEPDAQEPKFTRAEWEAHMRKEREAKQTAGQATKYANALQAAPPLAQQQWSDMMRMKMESEARKYQIEQQNLAMRQEATKLMIKPEHYGDAMRILKEGSY